ncbi:MAG: hypothetical protein ACT4P1_06055 [Sporichthyaceae bacterium]
MSGPEHRDAEIVRIGSGRLLKMATVAFVPLPVLGAPIESVVEGGSLVGALTFSAGVLLVAWFAVFRPKLIVTETKLRVVNPLWNRTVERDQVVDVVATYFGLEISRRIGRPAIAFAIGRSNYSSVVKTTSRAVVIQDAVRLWAQGDSQKLRELPVRLR